MECFSDLFTNKVLLVLLVCCLFEACRFGSGIGIIPGEIDISSKNPSSDFI